MDCLVRVDSICCGCPCTVARRCAGGCSGIDRDDHGYAFRQPDPCARTDLDPDASHAARFLGRGRGRAGAEQGTHALTLHLNPEELGPVSVSIELNGSAARIEFAASEALTRHHLEAALPGLTQALQDQGVSLTQGGVHEASKESLAASAAGGQTSGGTGSDARQRDEALFDGRSGYGERAPRRETEMFAIDGLAVSEARVPASNGPSPGRAGRLDLFA